MKANLGIYVCVLLIFLVCATCTEAYSAKDSTCQQSTMSAAAAAHSEATLALAKKESAEHMHGMKELYEEMRKQSLIIKAFALDDPEAPDTSNENIKIVHFVRHGQGFHNLMADIASAEGREWEQYSLKPENPYIMPEILDAPLTEKGRQQAYILQPVVHGMKDKPELIVLSPNCRALQTGAIVFEELFGTSTKFLAHENAREETGVHICDKRRPVSRSSKEFPQIDFSLLETDEDVIFQDDHRETKAEVGVRVYKFMEWLSERKEKHVGVASHSGWLLTVFNGICECDESLKGWFQTGELRSVKLEFVRV